MALTNLPEKVSWISNEGLAKIAKHTTLIATLEVYTLGSIDCSTFTDSISSVSNFSETVVAESLKMTEEFVSTAFTANASDIDALRIAKKKCQIMGKFAAGDMLDPLIACIQSLDNLVNDPDANTLEALGWGIDTAGDVIAAEDYELGVNQVGLCITTAETDGNNGMFADVNLLLDLRDIENEVLKVISGIAGMLAVTNSAFEALGACFDTAEIIKPGIKESSGYNGALSMKASLNNGAKSKTKLALDMLEEAKKANDTVSKLLSLLG